MINIAGIPKAQVLQALFNASFQQGMGRLDQQGRANITEQEAAAIIAQNESAFAAGSLAKYYVLKFDYLRGRILKIDISGDELNPGLYDRDVGEGAAAAAIAGIKTS